MLDHPAERRKPEFNKGAFRRRMRHDLALFGMRAAILWRLRMSPLIEQFRKDSVALHLWNGFV